MSLFTAYLIGILPNIQMFFVFLAILSFALAAACAIALDTNYNGDGALRNTKYRNGWLCAGIVSAALTAATPTENAVLTIAGVYVGANAAVAVSELDGVKELPQNVIDAANSWLKGASGAEGGQQ